MILLLPVYANQWVESPVKGLAQGKFRIQAHDDDACTEDIIGIEMLLLKRRLKMSLDGCVSCVSGIGSAMPNMEITELKHVANR